MDPIFQLMEMVNPKEDTFENVGYFISGKVNPKLIEMLDKGGGRQKAYPTVGVTHFIAGEGADKDKMDEAKDIFDIPIVSPRWIIYSTHHGKALPANWFLAEGKELFAGLSFTTSGIRGDDLMTAWSLVTYHNGTFLRHLTKNCTHVIANETSGRKCAIAKEMNLPVICVDWITDSIKAGKRLSEKAYDPRLLRPPPPSKTVLPAPKRPLPCPPLEKPVKVLTPVGIPLRQLKTEGVDYPPWMKEATEKLRQQTSSAPTPEEQKQILNTHLNGTDSFSGQTVVELQNKLSQNRSTPPPPPPGLGPQSQGSNHHVQGHQAQRPHQLQGSHNQGPPQVQGHQTQGHYQVQGSQAHARGPQQPQGPQAQGPQHQLQGPQAQGPQHQVQGSIEESVPIQGQTNSVIRRPSGDRGIPLQSQQLQQPHQESPKEMPRPAATVEQMEIIQMINHDPQIKLQWAHMDQNQRMLLVQKLAQKNREERLRKEMMLKQQQMQLNHQSQTPNSLAGGGGSGGQDPHGLTPTRLPPPQVQGGMPSYSNQELMRLRFPQARAHQGNFQQQQQQQQPIRQQPIITGDEFGKEVDLPYTEAQTQQHQSQLFTTQQSPGMDPVQPGQSRQAIFLSQGNIGTLQQRQILVSQHQSGSVIRAEHQPQSQPQSYSPDEFPQRIPTSQQPQTSNQKVQAYLQNSIIPMQEQQIHMTVASQSQQNFYTTPQQRLSVRPVLVQGSNISQAQPQQQQPQQTLIVDPQSSPVTPREPFQWSPNSQSQSSSAGSFNSVANSPQAQQQRLISPTGGMGPGRQQPTDRRHSADPQQQQQQQQWSLRNSAPQLIYTSQPNMPYSQLMNQKTKTALANLLSNRLMGSTTPETPSQGGMVLSRSPSPLAPPPTPSSMSLPVQNRVSVGLGGKPQSPQALQRRLSNLNNSEKGALVNNNAPLVTAPPPPTPAYTSQSSRFYGHDPSIKLPEGGFLLGCVFWAAQELPSSDWPKVVLKHGGELEPSYSTSRVTHVLCETQKFPQFQQCVRERKRLVTLFWLNDVVDRRILSSPSQAVHLPLPFNENERPFFGELVCTTGFNVDEKIRLYSMCTLLGLRVTRVFSRANIGLIAKSPEGPKFLKAREWKKPVVNIQFLNELLFGHTGVIPMIHSPKYQQFNMGAPFSFDVALVAPLMAPWKTPLRVSNEASQKFQSTKRPADSPPEGSPVTKRLRTELDELFPPSSPRPPSETPPPSISGLPEVTEKTVVPYTGVCVMLAGFSDEMKQSLTEKVEELGGRVTTDRNRATHLILKKGAVSKTLVLFLAIKDQIVGVDWLRDSCAQRKFLSADGYVLTTDTNGVHQINYTSIFKMPNRNRLFVGLAFFISPSLRGELREIIEAFGGRISLENSMQRVYEAALKAPESYVVVACEDDEYLFSGWKGKEDVHKIIMVNREMIFIWIMKQEVFRKHVPSSSSANSELLTMVNSAQLSVPSLFDGSGVGGGDGEMKKMSAGELVPFGNA